MANFFKRLFGKKEPEITTENVQTNTPKAQPTQDKSEKKLNCHEYVDLALPSGTLWATCNVGAKEPEDYGEYFAWGEIQTKNDYNWNTYKYCKGKDDYGDPRITKYCTHSAYGYNFFKDDKTEIDPADDAVTMNWGSEWQMPGLSQCRELFNDTYTKTEWTIQNGVYGRKVISKSNGNSIFLPATGRRCNTSLIDAGSDGNYWSGWLDTYNHYPACYLEFSSDYIGVNNRIGRCFGMAVRPVRKQK